MIVAYSTSGMADRLFTLNQLQECRENTGVDYTFLFNKQNENCEDFEQYFRIDESLNVKILNVTDSQIKEIETTKKFNDYSVSNMVYCFSKCYIISNDIVNIDYLKSNLVFIYCAKGMGNLPGTRGFPSGHLIDNHLFPSEGIQRQLDAYMSESHWSDNVPVGIHIRRTDMPRSIRYSPDSLFYSKIDDLAKADPNVRIFLCTDDPNLKKAMMEKYGSTRILTRDVKPRRTLGSFEDAVMDMFLLSKCRELYGCIQSGFVELASRIGHIRLTRLMI